MAAPFMMNGAQFITARLMTPLTKAIAQGDRMSAMRLPVKGEEGAGAPRLFFGLHLEKIPFVSAALLPTDGFALLLPQFLHAINALQ